MPRGVFVREGQFYYRRTIPLDVQPALGRVEIWRSLRTNSPTRARHRAAAVAASVSAEIELARSLAELPFDPALLSPSSDDLPRPSQLFSGNGWSPVRRLCSLTFGEAYATYMADPTHAWSARTREAYETSRRLAVAVIGAQTPLSRLSRSDIREYMELLRFLPRNASKLHPRSSPRALADRCRLNGDIEAMSAANANVCLANLSSFLNWAVNEELLIRNPAKGLRLRDDTPKRDKRRPFSPEQLRIIFDAPLYRGCVDGVRGYAKPGTERPWNARFWIPLIGLHTGMRLNEICQLDVADVRLIEGVQCFVVTELSEMGTTDKKLKTAGSDRLIPVHHNLVECGLLDFVKEQRRKGWTKLFEEVDPGTKGIRAVAFSKWFTQFLRGCGANRERTSFHSFRHNFRDELRHARIDHDIAMALGGWVGGIAAQRSVSENYGSGHRIGALSEAVSSLRFSAVNIAHLRR